MKHAGVALLLTGCTLVTHFDPSLTEETNDRLCADGLDNDGDGLTDCQDWECLDKKPCCTLDALVFEDKFDAAGCSNAALDPDRWASWGTPQPIVCNGALHPNKAEQCYDVGVQARTLLGLHPGLNVIVHVSGRPEALGRLVIGLSNASDPVPLGATTVCASIEPVRPFAEARLVRGPTGAQVVAHYLDGDLGTSADLDPDQSHEVHLSVDNQGRLVFVVDGTTIAQSDPIPIPKENPFAQLSLYGRGVTAGFDDVRVTDGTQCESPGAWHAAPGYAALAGGNDGSWEAFQVFSPAVASDDQLLYGACSMGAADRCATATGTGRAFAADDGQLMRAPTNPLFYDVSRRNLDSTMLRGEARGYLTGADSVSGYRPFVQTFTLAGSDGPGELGETILKLGASGAWDDGAICCVSAVRHDGRVLLWYAGQRQNDAVWRIGLATSEDGVHFERLGDAPLMSEGGRDDFDGRGVRDPEVVWDPTRGLYRMWYTGTGGLGTSAIGYAVSTDGMVWHKYPANPVIVRPGIELDDMGSPAVLLHPDGMRMWLQGSRNQRASLGLFALENKGAPSP